MREATHGWSQKRASLASRALRRDPDGKRTSLESLAQDVGVSRETVRRARNDLLRAMEARDADSAVDGVEGNDRDPATSNATMRALRRVLTMTGPLAWDTLLAGWERAAGRPPFGRLPSDLASLTEMVEATGGLTLTLQDEGLATIATSAPEQLDQVGQFLSDSLNGRPQGVERSELFAMADGAGLRKATIATALSAHPAVTRVGRSLWALRGHDRKLAALPASPARRPTRTRPTAFAWASDGALALEFSVPDVPSPVIAVPRAVSDYVEDREFVLRSPTGPRRITVRNSRLWGFGPALADLRLEGGARAVLSMNLLDGSSRLSAVKGEGNRA